MLKPTHIGFVWYTEDDYAAARALMLDSEKLPETFNDWLAKAEQGVKAQCKGGIIPVKAYVHSQLFGAWCLAHNVKPDAQGRLLFANHAAYDAAVKARG